MQRANIRGWPIEAMRSPTEPCLFQREQASQADIHTVTHLAVELMHPHDLHLKPIVPNLHENKVRSRTGPSSGPQPSAVVHEADGKGLPRQCHTGHGQV